MPGKKGPFDKRIVDQDDETFSASDPESHDIQTFPKNEGLLSRLKEGFTTNDAMKKALTDIRKKQGWKTWDSEE